ncbi:MAG: DUF4912 domain-containing protein [Cyanobacterium sp. T60_A2020_053]|nr:DUF4912 domain-containing protein [Cyanobacterium sp. T60_A2020_053]
MSKQRPPIEEMTLRQLRKVASDLNIPRYSRMRKAQLLSAIQVKQREILPNQSSNFNQNQANSLVVPMIKQGEAQMEVSKFDVGQDDLSAEVLASVDEGLGDLPEGYGDSKIILLPRDPQWAYAYWDISHEQKASLRSQGGQQLALRLYDVTDIDIDYEGPHNIQEYLCDELAREWYLPIPVSDRDYLIDIGYRCSDGRWLVLARSAPVRIPPVYPSDWVEDVFISVAWEEDLKGKTSYELTPPAKKAALAAQAMNQGIYEVQEIHGVQDNPIYDEIFGMAKGAEAQRVAGSLYGSMQQVPSSVIPENTLSSYVFPSGMGMWAVPTASGAGMGYAGGSGVGMASGSGVGMLAGGSGAGLDIEAQPRKFWLVADAELIVYGATEPDATVTIGGRPIKLNPDGTFRFQMSFQDGLIDYPIMAVASDGEQTRSIHMEFKRQTPSRHTNTKEDAVLEWFPPVKK